MQNATMQIDRRISATVTPIIALISMGGSGRNITEHSHFGFFHIGSIYGAMLLVLEEFSQAFG